MIPTTTLPGSDRPTSAVGFGCNSLLGPKPRAEGLALLGEAFDAGVRHFDVARAYSSGDAEGVVGEFLAGRRDRATITTKFGLLPPTGGLSRLGWLRSVARRLMRVSPGLRKALGARSSARIEPGAFSVDQARASFEASLAALGTGRVEVLLLHEAEARHCSPELADFLAGEVAAGRVGRFGVGTRADRLREVVRDRPAFADVLQFKQSIVDRNREMLAPSPASFLINHGAIAGGLTPLRAHLDARPDVAKRWSDALGLDLSDGPRTMAPLLLSHALHVNPGGIVLFSSTRRETIRENLRAVADRRFPPDQLDHFDRLSRELSTTGPP